jgi:GNAT superfamily N-acetyltransferase
MMSVNPDARALAALPDLPRWVEARGLLLSGRGTVLELEDGCQIVCSPEDRLVVPLTIELSPYLEPAIRAHVPDAMVLIQDVMLPAARYHLADWTAEPATLYTLPGENVGQWPPEPWAATQLTGDWLQQADVPPRVRDELHAALNRSPVWTTSADGRALAFAFAAYQTESWFDISVETLPDARGRGLSRAAAIALILDRHAHGLRPVWGALESNAPSHRMAERLGFRRADMIWVLTRD